MSAHEQLPECKLEHDANRHHRNEGVMFRDKVIKIEMLVDENKRVITDVKSSLDRTQDVAYFAKTKAIQNDDRITKHKSEWNSRLCRIEKAIESLVYDVMPRFKASEEWIVDQKKWHNKWVSIGLGIFQSIMTTALVIFMFNKG